MKKILLFVLLGCMIIGLCACDNTTKLTDDAVVKNTIETDFPFAGFMEQTGDEKYVKYTFGNFTFMFTYEEQWVEEESSNTILKRTDYSKMLFRCFEDDINAIINAASFNIEIIYTDLYSEDLHNSSVCLQATISEYEHLSELHEVLTQIDTVINKFYINNTNELIIPSIDVEIKYRNPSNSFHEFTISLIRDNTNCEEEITKAQQMYKDYIGIDEIEE